MRNELTVQTPSDRYLSHGKFPKFAIFSEAWDKIPVRIETEMSRENAPMFHGKNPKQPTEDVKKDVNNWRNYQALLVQPPDFWLPSTEGIALKPYK